MQSYLIYSAGADCYSTFTMSSSGEASDEQNAQIVHVIQVGPTLFLISVKLDQFVLVHFCL